MLWFTFFNNKKEFCSELPFIIIIQISLGGGGGGGGGGGIPGPPPPLYEALKRVKVQNDIRTSTHTIVLPLIVSCSLANYQ